MGGMLSTESTGNYTMEELLAGEYRPLPQSFNVYPVSEEVDTACPICSDKVDTPYAPDCGHAVCQGCIQDWAIERGNRSINCPVCRMELRGPTTPPPVGRHAPEERLDRLLRAINNIAARACGQQARIKEDFWTPKLFAVAPVLEFLMGNKIPKLPRAYVYWDMSAAEDTHTFGAILLEYMAMDNEALRPGSIIRQQWLALLECVDLTIEGGFYTTEGFMDPKSQSESVPWLITMHTNHYLSKWQDEHLLGPEIFPHSLDTVPFLHGNRGQLSNMYELLVHYLAVRQYQRHMHTRLATIATHSVADPVDFYREEIQETVE